MYMTQIELQFPDDQDMSIVRDRLIEHGPETDNSVGLRFKAYLAREVGVDGSAVNEYAPFHVWDDLRGLTYMLWQSDGFDLVLEHFDRPPVLGWIGAGHENGPASNRTPAFASKRTVQFREKMHPRSERGALLAELQQLTGSQSLHSAMIGIDPSSWSAVLFALWAERPEGDHGNVYTVEHFSMPGIPYDI